MTDLDYIEHCLLLPDGEERAERFAADPRLRALLPEVYALADVPQPPDHHPEGDALVHSLLAVRHLPGNADPRLAWAALLHDVGKALTTREIDGRIRAFGHDREGVRLAEGRLRSLGMEAGRREDVLWLVRHHMFALSWQVGEQRRLSRRQWRFIADARFPLLLALMRVDALAAGGSPSKLAQVDFYRQARGRLAFPGAS
ncbi:HD family phosphohydrolase [Desulfuromonas versatilis]|uniref:HD family phosphohydrolase n=1 Tax=Desulfuromonas versatilis TaxID=2802975 RepID=A0ABN6E3W3_9BACT|nr:HD domain-containing protein [Desulfuromonas versatilis]BCR07035.1 HD family phosphohydrolase [Desulfuromonas versatilis]